MGGSVEHLTVAVRAKPGARTARIGGAWDDPPQLVVAVRQRAVDGRANTAVAAAVAEAFGVAPSAVELLAGARGRSKLLRIAGDPVRLRARLAELLAG